MAIASFILSIIALLISLGVMWAHYRRDRRESIKFIKENEIKLSFFISNAEMIDNTYFDQVQQDIARDLLFNIPFQISNKSQQGVIIEKISLIFKNKSTGNFIGRREYDFTNGILHIKTGEFYKKVASVFFVSDEEMEKYFNSTIVLRVELVGQPKPIYSKTQILVINDPF